MTHFETIQLQLYFAWDVDPWVPGLAVKFHPEKSEQNPTAI